MTARDARRSAIGRARAALLAGGLVAVLSFALTGCNPTGAVSDSTAPSAPEASRTDQSTGLSSSNVTTTETADQTPAPSTAAGITPSGSTPAESPTAALAVLATLPVQGRAPQTGYSRAQFGQTWSDDVTVDDGHNGCDTRNDVLRRDITDAQIKPGTQGCVVLSGSLADPYSGTVVPFLRGSDTSDDVQIDHLVALSDAWQTGAQQLTAQQRQNLANDPDNLQATLGWLNQVKGAGDAATWLPPNKNYRCAYVTRQIQVKAKYQLWVKPAEKDAMTRILDGCPPVIAGDSSSAAAGSSTDQHTTSAAAPPPTPTDQHTTSAAAPASTPTVSGTAGGPFENCAAARAAGAAPVHVGDPGYSTTLDGDRDGIACE